MTFIKKVEDFVCANCGFGVIGDGYTNHCSSCLWSKHVDMSPGDRKNSCRGLMEPIGIEIKGDKKRIIHKCTKCGTTTRCKSYPEDNFDVILQLIQKPVKV